MFSSVIPRQSSGNHDQVAAKDVKATKYLECQSPLLVSLGAQEAHHCIV